MASSQNMDERLKRSAEEGDVEALYSVLAQDPRILERIDQIPFVDTPLHVAATAGNTHFAMEIATMKPSYAWKLNHLGLSPLHLALQNGHQRLVTAMLTIDNELVRVKAKGRITPLHYVAEIENIDLLAEFLLACPSSIEDLTVLCETAVHIAVKNKRFKAFQVLLGWLRRVNKEEILKWKDQNGNTLLHIATSTNQPKVMKLLMKKVNVNAKNLSGLTAMDIFHLQGDLQDMKEIRSILQGAKAKSSAAELGLGGSTSTIKLADYFSRNLSLIEKRDKYLGILGPNLKDHQSPIHEVRNIVLVVAILIATATYQSGLSPPGGHWQDTVSANTTTGQKPHIAGQMVLNPSDLFFFFTSNTLAFYSSVCTILILITGLPYSAILAVSTNFILYAYYASVLSTFPSKDRVMLRKAANLFTFLMFVFSAIVHWIPAISSARHDKVKRRVDNLNRRLGGLV